MSEQLAAPGVADEFEQLGRMNGGKYWFARDIMALLGYESFSAFEKTVNKAIRACASLEMPPAECATQVEREVDGRTQRDYKLTRFGCFLTAINGDVRKPGVAAVQTHLAKLAAAVQQMVSQADGVERVIIRGDIADRGHILRGVAHAAGVENYAFFQNAGYRGMYNMDLAALRRLKGLPDGAPVLDFMGRQELAANLFRITETEAKIKNEGIHGQRPLEHAAFTVGAKVRDVMVSTSGARPEHLAAASDIKKVRKELKQTRRELQKIDKPKARKKAAADAVPD